MSVRYGIDLALQPSFTAKLYLTRQIVCGQYSSWNATRQMLRMPLTPYFPCPDDRLRSLEAQVESIARETADEDSYMLSRRILAADISTGTVVMEFEAPEPLFELQRKAMEAARRYSPGLHLSKPFRPCIALLEYGSLPEELLLDAARFADGVASGVDMTEMALPWRLVLTRYTSEAAGNDWSNGRWAADLSWEQLHSHRIYVEVDSVFDMLRLVKQRKKAERGERRGIGRFFGLG